LKNITPEGPELIVEILGSTKSQNAVKVLGQMIPVDATKPELLIALISTLGEIGGEEAILILNRIKKLQITGEVLEELNIAFRIIELGKVDYIAR
ncbi:MAG: hypothetical protein GY756_11465, partial [bacterium]|nr:hypothetical protein [bacterium]